MLETENFISLQKNASRKRILPLKFYYSLIISRILHFSSAVLKMIGWEPTSKAIQHKTASILNMFNRLQQIEQLKISQRQLLWHSIIHFHGVLGRGGGVTIYPSWLLTSSSSWWPSYKKFINYFEPFSAEKGQFLIKKWRFWPKYDIFETVCPEIKAINFFRLSQNKVTDHPSSLGPYIQSAKMYAFNFEQLKKHQIYMNTRFLYIYYNSI